MSTCFENIQTNMATDHDYQHNKTKIVAGDKNDFYFQTELASCLLCKIMKF